MSLHTEVSDDMGATATSTSAGAGTAPLLPAARSATATLPPELAAGSARIATSPLTWAAPSGEHPAVSALRRTREPRLRQLMGVCGWAAVLGGVSLVLAIRGLFGVVAGDPPEWYEPSVLIVGLTGIALTVTAFVTVQRRRLPWALLTAASAFLTAAMVMTANAF